MVPSPSIAPACPTGSVFRAEYNGPVNAIGAGVPLNIDLKYLPKDIRKSLYFRKQLQITFKSHDDALTDVTPAELVDANFFNTPGELNEYVQVFVTALAGTEVCQVIVTLPHSIVR